MGERRSKLRAQPPDHKFKTPEQLATETIVLFKDGNRLPRSEPYSTLARWADVGIRAKFTGQLVKLENFWYGNRRATTLQAYARFIGRLNVGNGVFTGKKS